MFDNKHNMPTNKKHNITASNIIKSIKQRITELNINHFDPSKEFQYKYKFITKNANDIKYDLIKIAENILNRDDAINKINQFVNDIYIACDIEMGIFEFSLVHIIIYRLNYERIINTYIDRLCEICVNLDTNNKRINNQTLLPTILNGSFKPFFVAFLSPEQLHPMKWNDHITRLKRKESVLTNLNTTDIYKCSKCHERKFKITEIQMRSADEPLNRLCVCLVCGKTFIT